MPIYIIATPIGNLGDITLRALEALKEIDLLLCEDTRVTKKLLSHYGISVRLKSVHQHTQEAEIRRLLLGFGADAKIGYVCDAGTPGFSDPGGRLVNIAGKLGFEIIPLPGPSALSALLSVCHFSVLPLEVFGFAPHKKGRQKFLGYIINREGASMFCESPYRILKTLEYLVLKAPERQAVVGRELTKKFESVYRGTIQEVLEQIRKDPIKGEYSVLIGPI